MLAEFDGRKAVLTGDGHADLLTASLAKLRGNGGPIALDAFKLSHHGSHGTHSVELMQQIRRQTLPRLGRGSRRKHLHRDQLPARSSMAAATSNWCSTTRVPASKWDIGGLKNRFGCETSYPDAGTAGMIRTEL